MKESIIYYIVKGFGFIIRHLPVGLALAIGRAIGILAYYFDVKHKSIAYANLRMAFADSKSPNEIKKITKKLFKNYGQNFIELFRLPLINTADKFKEFVTMEGIDNVTESLKKGNGVILLAMHFGSWELANLTCAMFGYAYKVLVKSQTKYSKLDELLNSYRACGGSVVLSRGIQTRDLVKSLKNNEVIGMVVDQGGKDGVLVPFLDRQAAMSVGAIRLALKLETPICFSVIFRERGPYHRLIINKPLVLDNTGDLEKDIVSNFNKIKQFMEKYIHEHPSEYMWFYKIWKYSKETHITILSDGKVGHLRQSEALGSVLEKALAEREITADIQTITVEFKNKLIAKVFSFVSMFFNPFICQGRLEILQWVLSKNSFDQIVRAKTNYVISCGSSIAGVNYLLSKDCRAKSIAILNPGLLPYKKFDLVVLPQHDFTPRKARQRNVAFTNAALNLIDEEYLESQTKLLLNRFSHLKSKTKVTLGLFIGGDSKNVYLEEPQIKILVNQIKQVLKELNAQVLVTTSRRTPATIEQLLQRELKKSLECPLLILASKDNVPETVGGILGLSDIVIVSGDSISMISEAASSGKKTIVFLPRVRQSSLAKSNKHMKFIDNLNVQGFIRSTPVRDIGQTILDAAKNKIQTKRLDDNQIILEAARKVI